MRCSTIMERCGSLPPESFMSNLFDDLGEKALRRQEEAKSRPQRAAATAQALVLATYRTSERQNVDDPDSKPVLRKNTIQSVMEPTRVFWSVIIDEDTWAKRIHELAAAWTQCPGFDVYDQAPVLCDGAGEEAGERIFREAREGASSGLLADLLKEAKSKLPTERDAAVQNDSYWGIWSFFSKLRKHFVRGEWKPRADWMTVPTGETPEESASSQSGRKTKTLAEGREVEWASRAATLENFLQGIGHAPRRLPSRLRRPRERWARHVRSNVKPAVVHGHGRGHCYPVPELLQTWKRYTGEDPEIGPRLLELTDPIPGPINPTLSPHPDD